jgi:hypothetical protein
MRRPLVALSLTLAGLAHAESLPDGTLVGEGIHYSNVSVLPLYATDAGSAGQDYLVLDEGMAKGVVKIVERGDSGSVNQLLVDNRSDRPLFLMSGEVILGGKQDRIIGKDTIIPPKQRTEVGVFCVEHGRWAGGDKSFRSANAMAHTKLRKRASFAGQGEVWQEVAEKNKVRGTENATDTYRRVATGDSTKHARAYEQAIGGALAKLADRDRVVGVAVAVNGEVVAIEQFASAKLFAKVGPKILRSYYVEALDVPIRKVEGGATPAKVVAFAKKEQATAAATVLEDGDRKTERLSGEEVDGTKVLDMKSAKPIYKSLHTK